MKEDIKRNEVENNEKQIILSQENISNCSTASIFSKEESSKEIKYNFINTSESDFNQITQQQDMVSKLEEINKNSNPNKFLLSSSSKFKRKSIYHGSHENKIKINVSGKGGVNIYSKMEKFLDKYQKNIDGTAENGEDENKNKNTSSNKNKKSIMNMNSEISNNSESSSMLQGKLKDEQFKKTNSILEIQNKLTATKKYYHLKSVKTELPNFDNLKGKLNLQQKMEFEEAQRAAILMRKLEYSKNNKIKNLKKSSKQNNKDSIDLTKISEVSDCDKSREIFDNEECKNDNFSNSIIHNDVFYFQNLILESEFNETLIKKIQIWWRKIKKKFYLIKKLQKKFRYYIFIKKNPKTFEKIIHNLLNFNNKMKFLEKKIFFYKTIINFNEFNENIYKVMLLQRNVRDLLLMKRFNIFNIIICFFLKKVFFRKFSIISNYRKFIDIMKIISFEKERNKNIFIIKNYFNKYKCRVNKIKIIEQLIEVANKFLIILAIKKFKLVENLQEKFNKKLQIISEDKFIEIKLEKKSTQITELEKYKKDNMEEEISKNKEFIKQNRKTVVMNQEFELKTGIDEGLTRKKSAPKFKKDGLLEAWDTNSKINLTSGSSNKNKKIILKTSSRDFIKDLDDKYSKSDNLKNYTDSTGIERINNKKIKIQYVLDEDDDQLTCYSRDCKCQIY